MVTLLQIAEENVRTHLFDNPSRIVIVGLGENMRQRQISAIMGRSPQSQNRLYVVEDRILKTEAYDPAKVEDPSLIIYNVMRSKGAIQIIGNGDQTDTTITGMTDTTSKAFFEALRTRHCEPDAPNFTPRITGYQSSMCPWVVALSVLKADPFAKEHWIKTARESGLTKDHFKRSDMKPGEIEEEYKLAIDRLAGLDHHAFPTVRDEFIRGVEPGLGYMITTYMPGHEQLPSFQGEPLLVPLKGTLEESMQYFWGALEHRPDTNFRVAVGGREIDQNSVVRFADPINRFNR